MSIGIGLGYWSGRTKRHFITRQYLLLCQNYFSEPCSSSSSCDVIAIPFQELDTVLSNETKHQLISCPFSSYHRTVG